ncbi:hypothetical protein TthAK1_18790 [Thermus thermophilus]|nr:hypothetical protein TthAK1_18790 [Thermus thermophilus]
MEEGQKPQKPQGEEAQGEPWGSRGQAPQGVGQGQVAREVGGLPEEAPGGGGQVLEGPHQVPYPPEEKAQAPGEVLPPPQEVEAASRRHQGGEEALAPRGGGGVEGEEDQEGKGQPGEDHAFSLAYSSFSPACVWARASRAPLSTSIPLRNSATSTCS